MATHEDQYNGTKVVSFFFQGWEQWGLTWVPVLPRGFQLVLALPSAHPSSLPESQPLMLFLARELLCPRQTQWGYGREPVHQSCDKRPKLWDENLCPLLLCCVAAWSENSRL